MMVRTVIDLSDNQRVPIGSWPCEQSAMIELYVNHAPAGVNQDSSLSEPPII